MEHSSKLIASWKENFYDSDAVQMIDGEAVLNYSHVRALYYGKGNSGGFREFYEVNTPLEQAEYGAFEIIEGCVEHLHELGIAFNRKFIGKLEKSPQAKELTSILLENAHKLFKKLANSRHQYGIPADEALNKCNKELHQLAGVQVKLLGTEPPKAQKTKLNAYVTIPENYLDDPFINDLWQKVEHSNENFFITGKAGTGKSTFLHFVARNTSKNVVIAAYTGIAAINVGGVTLHSFFQLPLRPLLPRDKEIHVFGKNSYKRKLIRKMDTLIIDEVSMVRADILEAIDHSLRINGGKRDEPFGGKQVILIGDLFQLPPVVKVDNNVEWQVFEDVYDSPYFFSSHTFKVTPFNFIEMPKIYRQADPTFKELLNKIREGNLNQSALQHLNQRHMPDYEPDKDEFVLTLVTTNRLANAINQQKLKEVSNKEFIYKARVEGEFTSERYPTDFHLKLREGAQIIFIRNDINPELRQRRWVNGTIAKIYALKENEIRVEMEDGEVHKVLPETWENRLYKYDPRKRRITSEVIGTFVQYPVKLAWAITIHKSQGLTFDRLHLNTGSGAFAHGQTYVALSRCRSLEGLTLKKPVRKEDIILDQRVLAFYRKHFIEQNRYLNENKIISLILRNPDFFKLAFALHYPFRRKELTSYKRVLPYGKPYYSYFEEETGKAVFSEWGLVFNNQIDWQEIISRSKKAAAKALAKANTLPLNPEKELTARLDVLTRKAMQTEDYEKAGKQAKALQEARELLHADIPEMPLTDLEKVIRQKPNLKYVLNRSLFENNVAARVSQQMLQDVMNYLDELKVVWQKDQ